MSMSTEKTTSPTADQDKSFFDENGYIGPFTVYDPEAAGATWKKVRGQLQDKKNAVYGDNKMN